MVFASTAVAGVVLGVRHALEADHLAAVATLVEEGTESPVRVGASWGIGHSLPIVALGLLFVVLGIQLPPSVTRLFEVFVGIILVYLGARMLLRVAPDTGFREHSHRGHSHRHFKIGRLSLGATHQHLNGDSFLVGVVHGFAGSGALVVVLVSTAPGVGTALLFLVSFCLLSILTMAAVSYAWGRTLGTGFTKYLEGAAGVIGLGVGVLLLVEQLGLHVPGPF
jgi:putative Mn2+ efflux pump MntP